MLYEIIGGFYSMRRLKYASNNGLLVGSTPSNFVKSNNVVILNDSCIGLIRDFRIKDARYVVFRSNVKSIIGKGKDVVDTKDSYTIYDNYIFVPSHSIIYHCSLIIYPEYKYICPRSFLKFIK